MNQIRQHADFLSIALESFEADADEIAKDFITDVAENIDGEYEARLVQAVDKLNQNRRSEGVDLVEGVYDDLLDEIDDL